MTSYRDTWRLLLTFARDHTSTPPCALDLGQLDADLIGAFLDHLRTQRHNSARTRNLRLTAIHSLFSYAALLAAPDRTRHLGRRDHTLLAVAIATGLRVTELTGLTAGDVTLGTAAHLRCHGKGRKDRITPLTKPVARLLADWIQHTRPGPADPVFPTRDGHRLSTDAVRPANRSVAAAPRSAWPARPSPTRRQPTPVAVRPRTAPAARSPPSSVVHA